MLDCGRFNQMPFAIHNGFRFESAADGRATVSVAVEQMHTNVAGTAHGGVIATIIDAAGAVAVISLRPVKVVSADLRVNFIGPVHPGDVVTARSEVTHMGDSTAYAHVAVTNQRGDTVALGQVTVIMRSEPHPATL